MHYALRITHSLSPRAMQDGMGLCDGLQASAVEIRTDPILSLADRISSQAVRQQPRT